MYHLDFYDFKQARKIVSNRDSKVCGKEMIQINFLNIFLIQCSNVGFRAETEMSLYLGVKN